MTNASLCFILPLLLPNYYCFPAFKEMNNKQFAIFEIFYIFAQDKEFFFILLMITKKIVLSEIRNFFIT